jgi:hypothetical protein
VAVFLIHLCDANLEALTPFDYVRGFAFDGFFAHRVFPLPKKKAIRSTGSKDTTLLPDAARALGGA